MVYLNCTLDVKDGEPLVGIINTDPDLVGLIKRIAEEAGFRTAAESLVNLRQQPTRYSEFLREFNPSLIIIDIPVPYDDNCRYAKSLIKRGESEKIKFMTTSTNKKMVESCSIKPPLAEVIEVPFNVDEFSRTMMKCYQAHKANLMP